MRFASAAVSPRDVMGQRQTALNDYFTLTEDPPTLSQGLPIDGTFPLRLHTPILTQPQACPYPLLLITRGSD